MVSLATRFREEAVAELESRRERLRSALSFDEAKALPSIDISDVVFAGREAHLTIFRQDLGTQVLVTLQVARHGLGGVTSLRIEKGLVFSPEEAPRDATDAELEASSDS